MTATTRPTLDSVERRRSELLGVTFFVLVAMALMSVLLTFVDESSAWMSQLGGGLNIVRVSLVLLTLTFAWYVRQQQSRLRQVAKDLVNERVVSAALANRLREVEALTDTGHVALESSLATILGTVGVLGGGGDLPRVDRDALDEIERRAEELLVASQTGELTAPAHPAKDGTPASSG